MTHWLRLHAPNAGGPGAIPSQGTRSHMLQLRVLMPQLRSWQAVTKTRHNQINKYFFLKNVYSKAPKDHIGTVEPSRTLGSSPNSATW